AALDLAPATAQLLLIVVTIVLFTFTFNMADDIHKALRADLVQDAELNVLSSLATTVEVGVLATVVGVKEQPPEIWRERTIEPRAQPGERLPLVAFLRAYRGAFMF